MARRDPYMDAIKDVLNDKTPARPTSRTKTEIANEIVAISDRLKGPLSNVERVWLIEDRSNLRKQLSVAAD